MSDNYVPTIRICDWQYGQLKSVIPGMGSASAPFPQIFGKIKIE
jgi:hypothetical protein